MKYWSVVTSKLPAQAMALYPFMVFKNHTVEKDKRIIRHEQIHFRQQIELLIVFFYVLYLFNYLANLLKYRNHEEAYFNICFEREAYRNDHNLHYLAERKFFAWKNMI